MSAHPTAAALASASLLRTGAAEAAWPGTISIQGVIHEAMIRRGTTKVELDPLAIVTRRTLIAAVRKTLLISEPVSGTMVTERGEVYTLREVGGRNTEDPAWMLHCIEADK